MSPDPTNASSSKDVDAKKPAEEVKVVKQPVSILQELRTNTLLIDRSVSTLEPRFTQKVLRTLTTLRKKLASEKDGLSALKQVIEESYPKDEPTQFHLVSLLPASPFPAAASTSDSMDVDSSSTPAESTDTPTPNPAAAVPKPKKEVTEILPEVDVYLRLLVILVLIDAKEVEKANALAQHTLDSTSPLSRRSLSPLLAKIYFYLSLTTPSASLSTLRPMLLTAHRTATLRHDAELQATLVNLLLGGWLGEGLVGQADKFVSKMGGMPEGGRSGDGARFSYYLGRIRAVQLNYTEAHTHLQQAIRRAPPAHVAPGFLQTVYKFFIVVELLMGNIPDRSIFRMQVLKKALVPYFQIVQAVRTGDLSLFTSTLSSNTAAFTADSTLSLIHRLRQTVLLAALRLLSLAYSRISLRDVAAALQLSSEQDAEYVVTKAIKDGVIGGGSMGGQVGVDHEKGEMVRREAAEGAGGVYEGLEPRKAFGERVGFCLELRNESVKAMRYPLNAHRKDLEGSAAAREREKELANEIAEGGDLEEEGDDF